MLIEVPPGSFEFSFVEHVFNGPLLTVPGERIDAGAIGTMGRFSEACRAVRVQRIVNPMLWRRYIRQRDLVAEEHGGDANEIWVLHGTGDTDPAVIWRSGSASGGNGIDRNMSMGGLLGQGAYYAEAAAYSHGFRFNLPGGTATSTSSQMVSAIHALSLFAL